MRFNQQTPTGRANLRFIVSFFFNLAVALFVLTNLSSVRELVSGTKERFESERKVSIRPDRAEAAPPSRGQEVRKSACKPCDSAKQLCKELGDEAVQRAIDSIGPNNRLRRKLAKIRSGQTFNVAAIGGSASLGHGLKYGLPDAPDKDVADVPGNLHRIIFDYLHSLAPSKKEISFGKSGKKEGKNGFINGSKAAAGSGYFAYCFAEHIPQDVDIIIVELGINDELLLHNLDSYEFMLRGLLDLPSKPAIIYAHIFNLQFAYMAFGGDLHRSLNKFYEIPTISLRDAMLGKVLGDNTMVETMFGRNRGKPGDGDFSALDLRHISPYGHRLMGSLVNAYIGMQVCDMENSRGPPSVTGHSFDDMYPISPIPRMRLMQRWDPDTKIETLHPSCYSMDSKVHPLVPITQKGWRIWNWQEKFYWIATEPGSTITFNFTTVIGEVHLHHQRSRDFGLGDLYCWVDDDKDLGVWMNGWWHLEFNIAQVGTIKGIDPGTHSLNCLLQEETHDPKGGHEFRIIGITSV